MNEDQILSEYIDGELPPDLCQKVELRLQQDASFQKKLQVLKQLKAQLQTSVIPVDNPDALVAMQTQVWQRMQRKLGTPVPHKVSGLMGFIESLNRRIALPLPALAAIVIVVLALGIIVLGRGTAPSSISTVANANGTTAALTGFPAGFGQQEALSLPSTLSRNVATGGSDMPALRMSREGLSAVDSLDASSTPLEVTIEVQNLRQLLSLLENSKGISQVSIQLPRTQTLQPLGEPMLLKGSEINPPVTTVSSTREAAKP